MEEHDQLWKLIRTAHENGLPPLHYACKIADKDSIDLLLHLGACRNRPDDNGMLPIEHVPSCIATDGSGKNGKLIAYLGSVGFKSPFDHLAAEISATIRPILRGLNI